MTLQDSGTVQNLGEMAARAHGSLNVTLDSTQGTAFANFGRIEADTGGSVTLSVPYLSTGYAGTLWNVGHLVDDGTMAINANVQQTGSDADITVENGGVLNIGGEVSGNTVSVTSADLSHPSTLNFTQGDPKTSVPLAAGQFASELDLTGAAKISFNNLTIDAAVFDPTAQTLAVNVMGTDGNDHAAGVFHLGGSTTYDASQFTVAQDGKSVMWADTTQQTS